MSSKVYFVSREECDEKEYNFLNNFGTKTLNNSADLFEDIQNKSLLYYYVGETGNTEETRGLSKDTKEKILFGEVFCSCASNDSFIILLHEEEDEVRVIRF